MIDDYFFYFYWVSRIKNVVFLKRELLQHTYVSSGSEADIDWLAFDFGGEMSLVSKTVDVFYQTFISFAFLLRSEGGGEIIKL